MNALPFDDYANFILNSCPKSNEPEPVAFIMPFPNLFLPENEHGIANGYVAVPPSNRYYGKTDEDITDIRVHGGITLSRFARDFEIIYEHMLVGCFSDIQKDWWILGFDTGHCGDNPKKWGLYEVSEETYKFYDQITR